LILVTNALSAFIDGDAEVGAILGEPRRAAIPVIVLGELRYGILGSRHRKTHAQGLDEHLRHFDLPAMTVETTVP
jgi:predicted nucleic acid-binding protein